MSRVPAADASEIIELLARYAHVVDNREWRQAKTVFRADVQLGRSPVISSGLENLEALVGSAPATHGHNTTDVILDTRPDGTVRAWSKLAPPQNRTARPRRYMARPQYGAMGRRNEMARAQSSDVHAQSSSVCAHR